MPWAYPRKVYRGERPPSGEKVSHVGSPWFGNNGDSAETADLGRVLIDARIAEQRARYKSRRRGYGARTQTEIRPTASGLEVGCGPRPQGER